MLPAHTLKTEHSFSPLAIATQRPLLSWHFPPGARAVAIQILVHDTEHAALLWDSGWVECAAPWLRYQGPALAPYQQASWQVRWRGADGVCSAWSACATWRMGVLNHWHAQWIGHTVPLPGADSARPTARELHLRTAQWLWAKAQPGDVIPRSQPAQPAGTAYGFTTEFVCAENSTRGWLRIAADGTSVEIRLNGLLIAITGAGAHGGSDSWLLPQDFALTPHLQTGTNRLEIRIAQERSGEGFGFQAVCSWRDAQGVHRLETGPDWSARHEHSGESRELVLRPAMWQVPRGCARLRTDQWAQTMANPILRKTFTIKERPVSAILSVSGLGFYEVALDGQRVGDRLLDPAFTNYNRRVLYSTYDLTPLLEPGAHALGALLGNGWWNHENFEIFDFDLASWRGQPRLLLQLRIAYADGTLQWVVSDGSWLAERSPIVLDGIRNGELYDARLEQEGWNSAAFDDSRWTPATILPAPAGQLVPALFPGEEVVETLHASSMVALPEGRVRLDFPRNISGRPHLHVRGPAGTQVHLRCREVADDRLDAWTHQGPFQTDVYILKGADQEHYAPRFAYHGFSSVEITGYPGEPTLGTVTADVVHTAFQSRGTFRSGSELVDRIQSMTVNAFLSNFHGLPTDCPTREKAGWTADAYIAAETGLYNFDSHTAYVKWLADLTDCQAPDGRVPDIVPTDTWGYHGHFDWDCVIIRLPWTLYCFSGDETVLESAWPAMQRCFKHYDTQAREGILKGSGRGDWCPHRSITPREVTVTALLADAAHILAQAAGALGCQVEQQIYLQRNVELAAAFEREFVTREGRVANGTQTAQACALHLGLIPPRQVPGALAHLEKAIATAGGRLDVGIFGAWSIFRVLSNYGRHELACRILLDTGYPGYGWWAEQGLTTLPETWAAQESLNHIMFGDISAWFYRDLCGIRPDANSPGFTHFTLHPRPCPAIGHAEAEFQSMSGTIRSAWRFERDTVVYEFEVPGNAGASLYIGTHDEPKKLPPGKHVFTRKM